MSNNDLREIRKHMFTDVSNLQYLYLEMNYITYIEKDSLEDHKMLKILSLKGNKIREVHWNIFPKLKVFDLSSNLLKWFNSSWLFTNSFVRPHIGHFIQALLLSNNNISHLSDKTFKNLFKLIKLDLSCNYLYEIGEGIFSDQMYLRTLDLSKNRLTKFSVISFQHLLSIKFLYLDHN